MVRKVRCRRCKKLIGICENGMFENKHGRQVIWAERAIVLCPKCGEKNQVIAIEADVKVCYPSDKEG